VVREILQHINADLYALIDFESTNPNSYLFKRQIGTTFLQHFPLAQNGVQKYLPFLPLAIEQLDLRQYDVILSSSHAVAKGVITSPEQLHICYCHTPMRYAWELTFDYLQNSPFGKGLAGIYTRYLLHHLRQWDVISANRVDHFIANSAHTARRIWRCYRRDSQIIYPPVNIERFKYNENKEDFYVTVSRLVSYKNISLIVEAFNQLGKPLIIIGDGPDLNHIRKLAKTNIQVLGSVPDNVVEQYLAKAKAFVYAACEDFGIALVEAQACGTPIITYKGGGALETVNDIFENREQATGLFFFPQETAALVDAVEKFENLQDKFNFENCRIQAEKFTPDVFRQKYFQFLETCCQTRKTRNGKT
jgi:glycosyltransferase involved in cell wall biosynthesis